MQNVGKLFLNAIKLTKIIMFIKNLLHNDIV